MKIHITPKQRDTILAALRFYEANLSEALEDSEIREIATCGGGHQPLDDGDIDVLCAIINAEEKR